MDVGAFVQENRRWLLGVAAGGVLVLVGAIVVRSTLAADAAGLSGLTKSARGMEAYPQAALDAARAEGEQLAAERTRLRTELEFAPTEKYRIEGKGAPDEYVFQVGRKLRQGILTAANEREVQAAEKDIGWPSGTDDFRGTLFGLELLDEAAQRLFACHDEIRKGNAEAPGLRAILQLRVDERKNQRSGLRPARTGEVDLRDLLGQERIQVHFQADAATAMAFLESCRKPGRTLVIESVQMLPPQRLGDPVTVKAVLQGIVFRER
ncbi:MAG: hypothetical protein JNK49_17200 [Planctomycetes bacterium]|nr:hypothetical protein [Planctomycetota bacterium]